MPRKGYQYHFIYKTTNLINNKFYIGMHSTNNLNDGYFGSGKKLWRSIKKYGKENFKVDVLEFLPNRISLKNREKEIVTEEFIKNNKDCMNLNPGGSGGFCNENHRKKFHAAGGKSVRILFSKRHQEKMKTDPEYRARCIDKMKGNQSWLGKHHKEESKIKIGAANSISQKGEKNSQFGTCWITNDVENKKIKKEDYIIYEINGWHKGRKIKYWSN